MYSDMALYGKHSTSSVTSSAVEGVRQTVATASLLETWVDETEKRSWFLFEACRRSESA